VGVRNELQCKGYCAIKNASGGVILNFNFSGGGGDGTQGAKKQRKGLP